MPVNSTGIKTHRDDLVVDFDADKLHARISDFVDPKKSDEEIRSKYFGGKEIGGRPAGDNRDWKLVKARVNLRKENWQLMDKPICYRPFDIRQILYSSHLVDFPRTEVMRHFVGHDNVGLIIGRQGQVVGSMPWNLTFVSKEITDFNLYYRGGGLQIPLYLYPEASEVDQHNNIALSSALTDCPKPIGDTNSKDTRRVNFNGKLWEQLRDLATDGTDAHPKPDETQTLDYIYGYLHSPKYRSTYATFLKSNFPRIPWPQSPAQFWHISQLGKEIRRLHLMDQSAIGITPYPFTGEADSIVQSGYPKFAENKQPTQDTQNTQNTQPTCATGRVYINPKQYFNAVPKVAYDFYIGGYQPAQKWLKDRKGRVLSYDDITHYQRIIKILTETHRLMQLLDT